jgi:hypothetical protein
VQRCDMCVNNFIENIHLAVRKPAIVSFLPQFGTIIQQQDPWRPTPPGMDGT